MRHFIVIISVLLTLSSCQDAPSNQEKLPPVPTDTLLYSYSTVTATETVADGTPEEDLAKASVEYPVIKGSVLADSISAWIQKTAFYGAKDAQVFVDSFVADAVKTKNETNSTGGWYLLTEAGILYQTVKMLAAFVMSESYTGGTHGSHQFSYVNVDYTGKTLSWETILDSTKKEAMISLNDRVLRAIKQIPENRSWSQEGFLVETPQLPLPENFAFTKDGLLVCYNEYEIAPYSMGPIVYTISYSQLTGILKEGIR